MPDPAPDPRPESVVAHRTYREWVRENIATAEAELNEAAGRLAKLRAIDRAIGVILGETAGGTRAACPPKRRHADVAHEILARSRRPMKVAEIIAEMLQVGHALPAAHHRYNAVYTAMIRRPAFRKIGRGYWQLV